MLWLDDSSRVGDIKDKKIKWCMYDSNNKR